METYRRVSQGHAEHELPILGRAPTRRDSELESIAPARRQDTHDTLWSTQTLTQTLSPDSTHTTGSSSESTSSTKSYRIKLIESNQLRSAVNDDDSQYLEQLIKQQPTENEVSTLALVLAPHCLFDCKVPEPMGPTLLTIAQREVWNASALFLACSSRRKSLAEKLLRYNPNVSVIDEEGLSIMHATIGDSEQLSKAKEQASAEILELLVKWHPSLISSRDKEKRQPLHYCAMTGNCCAAEYILRTDRTTVNATDNRWKTPLYHICEHHSPNKDLVKLLLRKGGNFGKRNRPTMNHVSHWGIKKLLDEEGKKRNLTLPA